MLFIYIKQLIKEPNHYNTLPNAAVNFIILNLSNLMLEKVYSSC